CGPGYQHWTPEKVAWFRTHCSLTKTAFTSAVFALFRDIIQNNDEVQVDQELWNRWTGSKVVQPANECSNLHVAMKGVPGRRGVTWDNRRPGNVDDDWQQLDKWTGDK